MEYISAIRNRCRTLWGVGVHVDIIMLCTIFTGGNTNYNGCKLLVTMRVGCYDVSGNFLVSVVMSSSLIWTVKEIGAAYFN